MFDMIITKRFEKHPGHRKIQEREYAIEEDSSGHEINRSMDLAMCLRPGQKIDMSVLFSENNATGNICPRCKTESAALSETRTQWLIIYSSIYNL
jgi:hypothetical protein